MFQIATVHFIKYFSLQFFTIFQIMTVYWARAAVSLLLLEEVLSQ